MHISNVTWYFSFSVLLHSNLCPSPWVYRVGMTVSLWKLNHQNMAARKLSAMPISSLTLKRVSASTLWHLKDLFLEPWASVLEVWLLWGRHSVRKFKLLPKEVKWGESAILGHSHHPSWDPRMVAWRELYLLSGLNSWLTGSEKHEG